jgi:DNA polymerase III subunit gamma/tau
VPGSRIMSFVPLMSYQVLARKYRPQKFSDVIGQDHVTRTLKNAIEQGRTAHGYIFSGHRGIGKTTIARILAMALNCRSSDKPVTEPCGVCDSCVEIRAGNAVDVIEIDAATNRGIDEIRELREAARYRPARDRFKIYILDEAHQITDAAFNALLKTLEEPPGHVIFMMATTQPEDIPQTIRSRCQHFSFRAVKFDQIVGQLRELCGKENIPADEDALALLAEAGDGSVRDALSLLDQAIASSEGRLSAEGVRQLIGVAPSGVLEQIMKAVSQSASQEILQITDRLLGEGQNPVHFAKQLVRFLRNAIVAKVAGSDSSLLQISSDESARVVRIAELFSEEDLTRHLQIMLRTHSELGYRQEQRFHLELGLLKMAHAQRLLPLEQLLSGIEPGTAPERKPAPQPEPKRTSEISAAKPFVSPFAADSARKGTPRMESPTEMPAPGAKPAPAAISGPAIVMGSAAPAPAFDRAPQPVLPNPASANVEEIRSGVLNALATAGLTMLSAMLEPGEWKIQGNELIIRVPASATLIEMSISSEGRRMVIASASGAARRALKLQVLPGGQAQAISQRASVPPANGSSRARAEQEPVVQRLRDKFGAEIRTVIDYRQKK